MGYGMTICNFDGEASDGAGRERPDYFGLNISGMTMMLDTLYIGGVLDLTTEQPRDFPPIEAALHGEAAVEEVSRVLSTTGERGRVPFWKFTSNEGWHVIPDEASAMASALETLTPLQMKTAIEQHMRHARKQASENGNHELDVYEEPVTHEEVSVWQERVRKFASFCRRSAEHGDGFSVY